MKILFIFLVIPFCVHAQSDPINTPVQKIGCWIDELYVKGNLEVDESCLAHKRVVFNESNSRLNCNGATLDMQFQLSEAIVIDSKGNTLENIVIENCIIKNTRRKSIFIGWSGSDRAKEEIKPNRDEIYKSTPRKVSIINTKIETSRSSAIYIDDYVSNVLIDTVDISNTDAMAIYLEHSSTKTTIRNSSITNAGKSEKREAISIDSSSENVIENNQIKDSPNGGIFMYRNCGERYYQDKTQVIRKMSASKNIIRSNVIDGSRYGVWIASRQSRNQENVGCGIGYFAENKYAVDDAKYNTVEGNKFNNAEIGVLLEDSFNKVLNNDFIGVRKIGVRVGSPYVQKYLGEAPKFNEIKGNKSLPSVPVVRYMWGSKAVD